MMGDKFYRNLANKMGVRLSGDMSRQASIAKRATTDTETMLMSYGENYARGLRREELVAAIAGEFMAIGGSISYWKTKVAEMIEDKGLSDHSTRIEMAVAEKAGIMKFATHVGWGTYRLDDIDGGLGSVWFIESDGEGKQFLVKRTDQAGDIVRRAQAAKEKEYPPGFIRPEPGAVGQEMYLEDKPQAAEEKEYPPGFIRPEPGAVGQEMYLEDKPQAGAKKADGGV